MSEPIPQRAPPIAEKLEAARSVLAALEGELAQHVLDAAEGSPGSAKRLAELRSQLATSESAVAELEKALELARRIDRQAVAGAATEMRAAQLIAFKAAMATRDHAMSRTLEAAAAMAIAYGEYSEATLTASAAIPTGTVMPAMNMGPNGLFGAAFGQCERLLLTELFRLAPRRADGSGTLLLPFAKPSAEAFRNHPEKIPAAVEEFMRASDAIVRDIERQVEKFDQAAMRAALTEQPQEALA
ncbi:hypothetical protein [Nitrobacter vulgaris]|uniref:Uncharacterized protein n=1 Tax=Nitrobacter vulgaris TaxID=29421 RepID=A0A1V4HYT9_NITVU|nr:hypothetical protein [Nitrobacter vulgaris]OPH83035.1 hypothetical protein B2M20_08565 [Nitrobacter vulgaris]HEU4805554.1 hypothetical protein [Nitrobacter sp.]